MPLIVDLKAFACSWCGMSSDDVRVVQCPSCGLLTCYECVYLFDGGTECKHTTPKERGVLTRQDWDE